MQPLSSNTVSKTPTENTSNDDIFTIYHLSIRKPTPPIPIFITITNQQVPMEVDKFDSTSIINWDTLLELKRKSCPNLSPTVSKLRIYSGEMVSPKGGFKKDVTAKMAIFRPPCPMLPFITNLPHPTSSHVTGQIVTNCF